MLDSSGNSLHKRGWRISQNDAPLNENLAAALIRFTDWNNDIPLIDGMCGSATILMEAISMAINYPPGLKRNFAFEKWKNFSNQKFNKIKENAKNQIKYDKKLNITGIDISKKSINISRKNLQNAGFLDYVNLTNQNFLDYKPSTNEGIIILNPPYGVRMEDQEEILNLYKLIGKKLKFELSGFTAWIISSNNEALKQIGLKPSKKISLMNGALDVKFNKYELFSGKLKDYKTKLN